MIHTRADRIIIYKKMYILIEKGCKGFCNAYLEAYNYECVSCKKNSKSLSSTDVIDERSISDILKDLPELYNQKPHKPYSNIWWFAPTAKYRRMNILREIIDDMTKTPIGVLLNLINKLKTNKHDISVCDEELYGRHVAKWQMY